MANTHNRATVLTYETTTEHEITHLEVSVEIDDEQDISFLLDDESDINHPDATIRAANRADAILKAQHGRSWGMVQVLVRSQPDNVVRASLAGIDARASETLRANPRAAVRSAEYFNGILVNLVDEARQAIKDETDQDAGDLPVHDAAISAPIDGAELRDQAADVIDWWTR